MLHAVRPPQWAWGHEHKWETWTSTSGGSDDWFWLCLECGTTLPRFWDDEEDIHAVHWADVHGGDVHVCDCFKDGDF